MKLFIGCSSRDEIPQKYKDDCRAYVVKLFREGHDLVFGACNHGIMGISYDEAKKLNREIIGVCPTVFEDDLKKLDCTGVLTNTISERTDKVIEECDAIILLPGGVGTAYELLAALEFKRSFEFDKPIIIYNSHNFFDKLLDFLEKTYKEGFTSYTVKDCYYITSGAEDTLEYLNNYKTGEKLSE